MFPTIFGLWLGEVGTDESIRWMKFIQGFPICLGALHWLMFHFVFHHKTPFWLISNGQVDEAVDSLAVIYSDKMYVQKKAN